MASKQPIQASLQVDLDFTRIHEKGRQADQIAEQADRKAEEVRRKAREVSRELDQEDARVRRAVTRFQSKVLENPLKKIGKIGIAMAASEWAGASDDGDGNGRSYLGRVGKAALFGLMAGPEGAAISALGASVDWLIDEHRHSIREAQELRKMILQEKEERAEFRRSVQEQIERMEIEQASRKAADEVRVESGYRDLDYRTFLLMSE